MVPFTIPAVLTTTKGMIIAAVTATTLIGGGAYATAKIRKGKKAKAENKASETAAPEKGEELKTKERMPAPSMLNTYAMALVLFHEYKHPPAHEVMQRAFPTLAERSAKALIGEITHLLNSISEPRQIQFARAIEDAILNAGLRAHEVVNFDGDQIERISDELETIGKERDLF